MIRFISVVFFAGLSLTTASARANDAAAGRQLIATYCGIHSLYAAAMAEGVELPFDQLVYGKYVGCSQGSTLAELEQAATDHGIYALPVANMSVGDLMYIGHPVILHVKVDALSEGYGHYIVYLRERDGKAMVLDAGQTLSAVSPSDLAARWDGTGLIVSATLVSATRIFAPSRLTFFLTVLAVLNGVLLLRRFNILDACESVGMKGMCQRAAGIFAVAAIAGFVYHISSASGLLTPGGAFAELERASAASASTVSLAELKQQLASGNITLIDARTPDDYALGHLPGAISIPVSLTDSERRAAAAAISKSAPRVVIYCQSSGCTFSTAVAASLFEDGYSNLSIYPGGWQEWSQQAKEK